MLLQSQDVKSHSIFLIPIQYSFISLSKILQTVQIIVAAKKL